MATITSSPPAGVGGRSQAIVETVSINYEDFNDAFLTCATCLQTFNDRERRAKLLSCSHTVCAHCLSRIVQLPQVGHRGQKLEHSVRIPDMSEGESKWELKYPLHVPRVSLNVQPLWLGDRLKTGHWTHGTFFWVCGKSIGLLTLATYGYMYISTTSV
jgi:hypothetical protein